jgi:hypothetical protein
VRCVLPGFRTAQPVAAIIVLRILLRLLCPYAR